MRTSTLTNTEDYQSPTNFRERVLNTLNWVYEHTLNYPIYSDVPGEKFSKLRKKVIENRKAIRAINGHFD